MAKANYVFLANFSGSGSKLLQAQLSNSKNIFTIPAYPLLYFYPHFNEWKKKYKKRLDAKKTLSLLLTKHKSLTDSRKIKGFNGLTSLGKNKREYIIISETKFRIYFLKYLKNKSINSKNIIKAIHFSYKKTLNDKKKINLFHIHSVEYLNKYGIDDFPNSKIIFTIRNPIFNFWRRAFSDREIEKIRFDFTDYEYLKNYTYINRLRDLLIAFYNLNFKSKKNIKFIKFEDIKLKNNLTIKKICNFLKISYQKNQFNKFEFQNKKWWGDKIYKGYNKDKNFVKSNFNFNKDLKSFFFYEKFILEVILSPYLIKYKYKKKSGKLRNLFNIFLVSFLILLPTKYGVKLLFSRFNIKKIYVYLKESINEIFFNKLKNYYFNAMYKFKWNYRVSYLIKFDFIRKKIFYNKKKNLLKVFYFFIKILKYFYFELEIIFLYFLRIYLIFSLFFTVRKKIKIF